MRWNSMGAGLPEYVSDFAKRLLAAQAWIDKGGPTTGTSVGATTGPMRPNEHVASDGESEVDATDDGSGDTQLATVPKVRAQDLVRHVLDKGQWSETPAVRQGWKIFVQVSPLSSDLRRWC